MASVNKIGVQIGVENYSTFSKQISNITKDMKLFKAEMQEVTSSYTKENKTMKDVNKTRESYKKLIGETEKKIKEEKDAIEAIRKAREAELTNGERYSRMIQEIGNSAISTKEDLEKFARAEAENTAAIQKSIDEEKRWETQLHKDQAALNDLNNEMDELPADNFAGKIKIIKERLEEVETPLSRWGDMMKDIGSFMTKSITVPVIAGATAAVKAYSDWETALVGVKKTTNMEADELARLETELKQYALTTAYSSVELANIAQIAGQLGIRGVDDIMKFTKVVSDMALSTDLSTEEAATYLARILNITEHGNLADLEKFGSVIVNLGNNLPATEGEITAMANRMASAASSVEFTTTEIFALSAALTSVGITAEAGGSTVGQVLSNIDKQFAQFTKDGTGNLEKIADISGMSATEFADTWKNEPVKAFEAFINGLSRLEEEGGNINITLDELDMAGIRQSNMLKALAEAQQTGIDTSGLFTKALELAEEAYSGVNKEGEEFNALQKESDAAKETAAVKFNELKESVVQLGQAFGEEIVPVLIPFVEELTELIHKFGEMDEGTKQNIIKALAFAAALGPLFSLMGNGAKAVEGLKTIIDVLHPTEKEAADKAGLLKTAFEKVTGSIANEGGLMASIGGGNVGLIGSLGLLVGAFFLAKDKATEMDQKMYESAEACEYVAKRYHWTEEKVNEFGYTWSEDGHLVEMTNDSMNENTDKTVEDMVDMVEYMKDQFHTKAQETAQALADTYEENVPVVQEKAHKMVMTGVDEIKTARDSTYSWGSELGQNFANGIASKEGSVASAVSGLASKVWSLLHFSEPETGPLSDFNSWMPDMMQQMAKGIEDNVYLVDNAIGRVADTLGMGGDSYNYGGVNIILNVPAGANGQQIVDEIETELANRTLRRKAVFG